MALYHYTTENRHDEILKTNKFNHSSDIQTDSTYGIGWYFTDLPPETCDKILMNYCWGSDTLHKRVKYYLQFDVVGAEVKKKRDHVFFVPKNPNVSFTLNKHGAAPECSLKPCSSCKSNPENK